MNALPNCECFVDPPDISNGQPVDAETLQPILQALHNNDLYLKSVLDYFQIPSALIKCVDVDESVQVGQPVYYSTVSGVYEKAGYEKTVTQSGRVFLAESAEVWGLVLRKETATRATILIDGITQVDLTVSAGSAAVTGKWYLGDVDGTLTADPSDLAAPVYILSGASDGTVLFRPVSGDSGAMLLQWKESLVCEPSGSVTITNGTAAITTVDPSLAGWLPASHASFGGNAPAGAKFGYNIAADADLADVWPPRYLSTAYLEYDRGNPVSGSGAISSSNSEVFASPSGEIYTSPGGGNYFRPAADGGDNDGPCCYIGGGTGVSLGPQGLAIIDEHGIWWLSDCANELPFEPGVSELPGLVDCPKERLSSMTLYAARPGGGRLGDTADISLLSTHPAFKFFRRDTLNIASTGALDFSFSPADIIQDGQSTLHKALKVASGNKIATGPVISRIMSDSSAITILGSHEDEDGYQYGDITVVGSGDVQRELLPLNVALRRAEEEVFANTLGIGLPARRSSGFRSQFVIPVGFSGTATLRYRVWVVARAIGSDPGGVQGTENLSLTRMVVAQPAPATDLLGINDASLAIPAATISHGKVYELISDSFTAQPGDVVYTDLTRNPVNLGFELHVIKHFLFVESVAASLMQASSTTCAVVTTSSAAASTTSAAASTTSAAASTTSAAASTTSAAASTTSAAASTTSAAASTTSAAASTTSAAASTTSAAASTTSAAASTTSAIASTTTLFIAVTCCLCVEGSMVTIGDAYNAESCVEAGGIVFTGAGSCDALDCGASTTSEAASTTSAAASTTSEAASTTSEAASSTTLFVGDGASTTSAAASTTSAAASTTSEAASTTSAAASTTSAAASTTSAAASTTSAAASTTSAAASTTSSAAASTTSAAASTTSEETSPSTELFASTTSAAASTTTAV